ncbi:MAG TPA: 50S ribosomal protein L11 methyltransferase [Thermoanaerobaculia bacterium]
MHYVLDITYPPGRADLEDRVEGVLFLTFSLGSEIGEREGLTRVACWFKTAEQRDEARAMLADLEGVELESSEREPEDWLALYRQSLEPLFIGTRFVVAPAPELIPAETDRIGIVIPQERAFGTGSHESTALCLAMLERADLDGKRGLDIGTGSAILAIAMARLGARKVVAFDNDLETWEVAPKNLERNGVDPRTLALFVGGIDALRPRPSFDVVTMNILPHVIIPVLPDVARTLAPGGRLILSGILVSQRGEVVGAAEAAGLRLVDESEKGEWWCGVVSQR